MYIYCLILLEVSCPNASASTGGSWTRHSHHSAILNFGCRSSCERERERERECVCIYRIYIVIYIYIHTYLCVCVCEMICWALSIPTHPFFVPVVVLEPWTQMTQHACARCRDVHTLLWAPLSTGHSSAMGRITAARQSSILRACHLSHLLICQPPTVYSFKMNHSTSFLFLVVRPLFLVAMPGAPSSILFFLCLFVCLTWQFQMRSPPNLIK